MTNLIRRIRNLDNTIAGQRYEGTSTMPAIPMMTVAQFNEELELLERKRAAEQRYLKRVAYRTASHVKRARKSSTVTVTKAQPQG